jgi:hypothetical protein
LFLAVLLFTKDAVFMLSGESFAANAGKSEGMGWPGWPIVTVAQRPVKTTNRRPYTPFSRQVRYAALTSATGSQEKFDEKTGPANFLFYKMRNQKHLERPF